MGTTAAWEWDCWAAESSEWHAGLSLSRTWACPQTLRWKRPTEGFLLIFHWIFFLVQQIISSLCWGDMLVYLIVSFCFSSMHLCLCAVWLGGWLADWGEGDYLIVFFFIRWYLRMYNRSEVESLLLDREGWEADAHWLCSKNLRLLLWMDVEYISRRVCHQR